MALAMETIELHEKGEAVVWTGDRYIYPRREAMKFRLLWTHDKPPSKSRDAQDARRLYKEASKCAEIGEESEKLSRLILKGLFLNPRHHGFYALRGDAFMRHENWTRAIKSYENARATAKFDEKLSESHAKSLYNRQLIEGYAKRGNWYCDNGLVLEAIGDYEQVLILKLRGMILTDVEDKLLGILRKLDKYDAFRIYWNQFMMDADAARSSVLLTQHAEFKIHMREMSSARHMLFEALDLCKDNVRAQELLQVVYNTGHTMAAYTVIWCMHGCYDKALLTIEKGRDCDPYNPGFTLLKTIVLRLSGRLAEAESWLEDVDKNFHKLLEPSRDKQGSIMGKLSMSETRNELIEQWYLIRYDKAISHVLNGNSEKALQIIHGSNLTKHYTESNIILGDDLVKRERTEEALELYLTCLERNRELRHPASRKTIDLAERIIDILNDRAKMATRENRSQDAIDITDRAIRILDEHKIESHRLGVQRGRALLHNARGHFQMNLKKRQSRKDCQATAESLRFVRGANEMDLYRALYADAGMEEVIDRFASKRKLPQSLKILMQFS